MYELHTRRKRMTCTGPRRNQTPRLCRMFATPPPYFPFRGNVSSSKSTVIRRSLRISGSTNFGVEAQADSLPATRAWGPLKTFEEGSLHEVRDHRTVY